MAVIENVSTEEGDVLRIKTDTPIIGLLSLNQFIDTTVGEDLENYFKKEFRYSVNGGLTFEDWEDLNLLNISNARITKFDSFVLEYKYTRVGNAPEVELEFKDILVSGEVDDLPYPQFENSVFNKFFNVNDINVYGWALNVLEKLYSKGLILPDYIERGNNESNTEDEDFIVYWNSITHFFAIIVYFARQFENFETNELLLGAFLKSRDLILPADKDKTDLLYLYQNYIAEYKKRGTLAILDRQETGTDVDGELLRLVENKQSDELIFALFKNFNNGWCIGKSSPTWSGTEKIVNIVKGYEFGEKVENLINYPLIGETYVSLSDDKIQINNVPSEVSSGVGGQDKKLSIDSSQDYEISFRVSQSLKEENLIFGCQVWDKDMNQLSFKDINSEVSTNYFFYKKQLNKTNLVYWVRGVLFKHATETKVGSTTTLGLGSNLRIPELGTFIVPIIGVKGTGSENLVKIDNIKIRPLKLNFSRGQLGIHNLIYLMTKNNNTYLSEEQIETFIKEKLIPYNSFLKTNLL